MRNRRAVRSAVLGALGLLTSAAAAGAAEPDHGAETASPLCVDVRIGQDSYYSCLNAELSRLAQQSHTPPAVPSIAATSPAPEVGTYNQAATRQRLGTAFGVSAIPQRPPPPVFSNPLVSAVTR